MAYSIMEQATEDIDWYFLDINNNIIHVASAGGRLPTPIAQRDDVNRTLNQFFRDLPAQFDFQQNPTLGNIVALEGELLDLYVEDFISFAQKGLYSYDKSTLGNFEDSRYHLVAKPSGNGKLIENIPQEIRNLLITPNNMQLSATNDILDFKDYSF